MFFLIDISCILFLSPQPLKITVFWQDFENFQKWSDDKKFYSTDFKIFWRFWKFRTPSLKCAACEHFSLSSSISRWIYRRGTKKVYIFLWIMSNKKNTFYILVGQKIFFGKFYITREHHKWTKQMSRSRGCNRSVSLSTGRKKHELT